MHRIYPRVNRTLGSFAIVGLIALFLLVFATASLAGIWLPGQQPSSGSPHAMEAMNLPSLRTMPVPTLPPPPPPPPPTPAPHRSVQAPTRLPDATGDSPVALGQQMAAERGWVGAQWSALYQLWDKESSWSPSARNPSSGACGIPQRHPCSGLSSLSAADQITWGLDYIAGRYGTPSGAWSHFLTHGWY